MKYKYIGTEEQLLECGFEEVWYDFCEEAFCRDFDHPYYDWSVLFISKTDLSKTIKAFYEVDAWSDNWQMYTLEEIDENIIADLIEKGLVEVV